MSWVCPMCSTSNERKCSSCFVCGYEHRKKRVSLKEIKTAFNRGIELYNKGNYQEAFEFISFAAEHRDLEALLLVAELYKYGRGTEIDKRKSYESYIIAAQKNDAYAQYQVALCYYSGEGTRQSYTYAIKWLEKASEQKYPDAIRLLANMYMKGEGVWSDYDKAIELFKEANIYYRPQNNTDIYEDPESLLGIALCYQLKGKKIRAAFYFKKSAKYGCAEAQYMLSKCYKKGYGVFKSDVKAKEWYSKAKSNGYVKKTE